MRKKIFWNGVILVVGGPIITVLLLYFGGVSREVLPAAALISFLVWLVVALIGAFLNFKSTLDQKLNAVHEVVSHEQPQKTGGTQKV